MAGSAKRGVQSLKAVDTGGEHLANQDGGPGLDRVIQAQIGDKLRAMYGELTDQPLPDRLTAILSRLGAESGRETGS